MKTRKQLVLALTLIGALMTNAPVTQAQEITQNTTTITQQPKSYASKVGNKALRGFANITTGILEWPKNVINVANEKNSNILFGFTGGSVKGFVNMIGRMGSGLYDFTTAPLPTKPIIYPVYIWDDFDADTSYDSLYRLDN